MTNFDSGGFRPDIQFLRGVAVLLVVLYHGDLGFLSAGYLGVDVFFVISGFLISGMVMRDGFSTRDFWFRRARRILPAAFVVLGITLLLAPWFLTADLREDAAEQAWGALLFVSNFVLWEQSGYFDTAAEAKPFLHFWSLSIEEQFYFFIPLLVMILPAQLWRLALSVLAGASLVACFLLVPRDAAAAFFLPFTRWWELLIGSILATMTMPVFSPVVVRLARIGALAGIVVLSALPIGLPHPGVAALVVCLAAATLLALPPTARRFNPAYHFVIRLGDISYALYLVHWPVFVFTRAAYDGDAPTAAMLVATAISVLLAFLLHVAVEQPLRRVPRAQAPALASGLVTSLLAIAAIPPVLANVWTTDFEQVRRHNYGIGRECAYGDKYSYAGPNPACQTKPDPQVLLIGDSYAMAWASALKGPLADVGIEQATMSACDPLFGLARYSSLDTDRYNRAYAQRCMEFVEAVIADLDKRPSVRAVVVAGRLQTILNPGSTLLKRERAVLVDMPSEAEVVSQALANLARVVRESGREFAVIAPPPADGRDIGTCLEQQASGLIRLTGKDGCNLDRATVDAFRKKTRDMLARAAALGDFSVLEMADSLCDMTTCAATLDGHFLYRDAGHLTVEGAEAIGRLTSLGQRVRDSVGLVEPKG